MKRGKVLSLLLVVVMMMSLLAGCGSSEPADTSDKDDGTLTIAFSQTGNQNNWKVTQTNDMKEKIEASGAKYLYTDAQDDTAKQISDIEDLISQKPDYLVISPREYEGLTPALDAAKEAGIPVILVDRAAAGEPSVDYLTLTCGDFVWEGGQIANLVVEKFGTEPCNVVELTGTPGSSVTTDRAKGFADGITGHDNIKVITSQVGNFSRAESQKAMENIIQAQGDNIDVVYCHNDDNAIGAIQALKAAGKKVGEDVFVYGIDGQKDALQAIIDGELEATVLCSARFGDIVLDIIKKDQAGEAIPGYIKNPGKVYTIDNAEASLAEAF
jgi:galactofuranose transport system substrate-binding protein